MVIPFSSWILYVCIIFSEEVPMGVQNLFFCTYLESIHMYIYIMYIYIYYVYVYIYIHINHTYSVYTCILIINNLKSHRWRFSAGLSWDSNEPPVPAWHLQCRGTRARSSSILALRFQWKSSSTWEWMVTIGDPQNVWSRVKNPTKTASDMIWYYIYIYSFISYIAPFLFEGLL